MDAQATGSSMGYRRTDLPVGECLERGWRLAMDNLGPLILYTLLLLAIHTALAFIPIVGWIASWVISPALSAGYFVYIYKRFRGEPARFEDFFGAMDHFAQLFLVGLVGGILIAVGILLCILPGLYLALGYMFASFLVVSRKLQFWQAMETSRRAVTDNLLPVIVLALALIGVNILGALACLVGLIVSIPLSFCATVVAFERIFGETVAPPPVPASGAIRID